MKLYDLFEDFTNTGLNHKLTSVSGIVSHGTMNGKEYDTVVITNDFSQYPKITGDQKRWHNTARICYDGFDKKSYTEEPIFYDASRGAKNDFYEIIDRCANGTAVLLKSTSADPSEAGFATLMFTTGDMDMLSSYHLSTQIRGLMSKSGLEDQHGTHFTTQATIIEDGKVITDKVYDTPSGLNKIKLFNTINDEKLDIISRVSMYSMLHDYNVATSDKASESESTDILEA